MWIAAFCPWREWEWAARPTHCSRAGPRARTGGGADGGQGAGGGISRFTGVLVGPPPFASQVPRPPGVIKRAHAARRLGRPLMSPESLAPPLPRATGHPAPTPYTYTPTYMYLGTRRFESMPLPVARTTGRKNGRGPAFLVSRNGHQAARTSGRGNPRDLVPSAPATTCRAELDTGSLRDAPSIRTLANTKGTAGAKLPFASLVRGLYSIAGLLGGYKTVPSPQHPGPRGGGYFSGGNNTRRHGSVSGGTIDGIQVEVKRHLRINDPDARRAFTLAFAKAVGQFMLRYYSLDLSDLSAPTSYPTKVPIHHPTHHPTYGAMPELAGFNATDFPDFASVFSSQPQQSTGPLHLNSGEEPLWHVARAGEGLSKHVLNPCGTYRGARVQLWDKPTAGRGDWHANPRPRPRTRGLGRGHTEQYSGARR
jgi:hypothetical protein